MGEVIDARAWFAGPPMMTKRQVAAHLGRTTRWVEIQTREHGLPSVKKENGHRRYVRSEVDEWIRSRGDSRAD